MSRLKKKLLIPLFLTMLFLAGFTVSADTGISYSPDGTAWTIDAGVTDIYYGEKGETITFNTPSTRPALQKGQHYYSARRNGVINVGKWVLKWPDHICTHNNYPPDSVDYCGVVFGRNNCFRDLQPGWFAYCADCGEKFDMYFYATRTSLENIKTIDTTKKFYSLCAYDDCNNLEMGAGIKHDCKSYISWNKYIIRYYRNGLTGVTYPSTHYYNNENMYDGNEVTPQTKLSKNQFSGVGKVFVGWNTEPDGSGISFADEEDFLSVQNKLDLGEKQNFYAVNLYAQYIPATGTLKINPNGGSYAGETTIVKKYGETVTLYANKLTPPAGSNINDRSFLSVRLKKNKMTVQTN